MCYLGGCYDDHVENGPASTETVNGYTYSQTGYFFVLIVACGMSLGCKVGRYKAKARSMYRKVGLMRDALVQVEAATHPTDGYQDGDPWDFGSEGLIETQLSGRMPAPGDRLSPTRINVRPPGTRIAWGADFWSATEGNNIFDTIARTIPFLYVSPRHSSAPHNTAEETESSSDTNAEQQHSTPIDPIAIVDQVLRSIQLEPIDGEHEMDYANRKQRKALSQLDRAVVRAYADQRLRDMVLNIKGEEGVAALPTDWAVVLMGWYHREPANTPLTQREHEILTILFVSEIPDLPAGAVLAGRIASLFRRTMKSLIEGKDPRERDDAIETTSTVDMDDEDSLHTRLGQMWNDPREVETEPETKKKRNNKNKNKNRKAKKTEKKRGEVKGEDRLSAEEDASDEKAME